MHVKLKRFFTLFSVLLSTALIAACSGTSAGTSTGSGTGSTDDTGTVNGTSGVLRAADGSPMAGASVAVSTSSSSSLSLTKNNMTNAQGHYLPLPLLTDDQGDTCEDIESFVSGTIVDSDCTGTDGAYTFQDVPCGDSITFTAKKGSFMLSISITVSCTDSDDDGDYSDEDVALDDIEFSDDCGEIAEADSDDDDSDNATDDSDDDTADADDDTDDSDDDDAAATLVKARYSVDAESCDFDIANMAVVTGNYDEIQNVLAKLGYGSLDDYGSLDESAETDFTLIDGNSSLDDETYDNFEDWVTDVDNLNEYDIIFINCGNGSEELSQDPTVLANLQEYVENGGKLYVTDWSYMFIEQPFPDFMDYAFGTADSAEDPEESYTAAKVGPGGITVDATVEDDDMREWLDNVTVNDGDIEEDCYSLAEESVNAREGALNDDDTVTIGDFLSAWVVMEGIHEGIEDEPTVWLSGDVTSYDVTSYEDIPFTATRLQGEGEILYSSYHTAHSCPTQGFWPQERVLQYLVFEL